MQIVKVRDCVGFGPEADASLVPRLLAELEERFIVISDLHFAAVLDDPQAMPRRRRDRAIVILYQVTNSLHDPVETYVLFDRACSQQIVVPVILRSPDQAAAEIGLARDGKERHFDIHVGARCPIEQDELIRLIRALGANLGQYLRGAFGPARDQNLPFSGRTPIEQRADHERLRQGARRRLIESPLFISGQSFRGGPAGLAIHQAREKDGSTTATDQAERTESRHLPRYMTDRFIPHDCIPIREPDVCFSTWIV